jgi:hypothetical protein
MMELPVGFASGMSAAITSLNGRFQSSGNTPDGDIFVVALWLNEAADLYRLAFLFRLARFLIPKAVHLDVEAGEFTPLFHAPFSAALRQ